MYGLVPYNISPIQQAIQFGHGAIEYQLKYACHPGAKEGELYHQYYDWAMNWKTFIVLNGGTTNNSVYFDNDLETEMYKGSLNQHMQWLHINKIPYSEFSEPDLGDQLTSVNFIVDERVFNKRKYPDFKQWMINSMGELEYKGWKKRTPVIEETGAYSTWVDLIGGETNVNLREWLRQFKFA